MPLVDPNAIAKNRKLADILAAMGRMKLPFGAQQGFREAGTVRQEGANVEENLNELWDYQYPENVYEQQKNVIGQAASARQLQMNRALEQRQAAMTGGRLGSVSRGYQEIGGQVAGAQQQALAQLSAEKMNVEMRMKLAALQAYIEKYGIDKNAMIALKQIKAQQDAAAAYGMGSFAGGALEFLGTAIFA